MWIRSLVANDLSVRRQTCRTMEKAACALEMGAEISLVLTVM